MPLVRLGKVVRPVGLGGRIGIAGTKGALGRLDRIALRLEGKEPSPARIVEARPQGRLWAVRLEGVADRDAAQALVGAEVLAEREDLGEAGEGRHFWADLEGLPVITAAGEALGNVTGLYETGGVDVLVVTGAGGEKLVPLAPYVQVDLEAGRIVVDPPEGLFDRGAGRAGPKPGSKHRP